MPATQNWISVEGIAVSRMWLKRRVHHIGLKVVPAIEVNIMSLSNRGNQRCYQSLVVGWRSSYRNYPLASLLPPAFIDVLSNWVFINVTNLNFKGFGLISCFARASQNVLFDEWVVLEHFLDDTDRFLVIGTDVFRLGLVCEHLNMFTYHLVQTR